MKGERRSSDVAVVLRRGALVVIPSETIYGIVARAADPAAVARLYRVRGRDRGKPCIVLIASIGDITRLGLRLPPQMLRRMLRLWRATRRPTSIIVPCDVPALVYLHRGTRTLALRLVMPYSKRARALRALIRAVGPLAAPSANPQGLPSAQTIAEAHAYFGNRVDAYVSARNRLAGRPSRLVRLTSADIEILRD